MIYKKEREGYPRRLWELSGMPEELYVEGELPDDKRPSIAIVGARNCSHYGQNMAYEYAKFLAKAGVQVISGLARGVDRAAHEGALAVGKKTFAVLGCGVDICYPAVNRKIFEKIKEHGGLISEFPNGSPPLAYHFPQRNRIISGLADAVLIIEAKEKSGSLITADWALEQGKTVFALPGRVGDLLSYGCNRLIYDGAVPAWCPQMILEEMHWELNVDKFYGKEKENEILVLASEDKLVYSCLNLTPKSITALQDETGLSPGALMKSLIKLQIEGFVKEVWKNNFIRQEE